MKVKPLPNYILFRPYWDHDKIRVNGDRMQINTTYEPGYHQPVRGEVVETCDFLKYGMDNNTLDWSTDLEVQKGDEIVVNFNEACIANSGRYSRFVYVDSEKLLLIRYDKIHVARRNGVIVPVNGYNIIEQIPPQNVHEYENPYLRKKKHDRTFGIVRHVAKKIRHYKYLPMINEVIDLEEGQVITIRKDADLFVESPNHYEFFKDKPMMKIQRVYITGLVG